MKNLCYTGDLVETSKGTIGRTYREIGLVNGKVPVFTELDNDVYSNKPKLIAAKAITKIKGILTLNYMTNKRLKAIAREQLHKCKGQPRYCKSCKDCVRFDNTFEKNIFEGSNDACIHCIGYFDYDAMKKALRLK